jgi:hypothetical protein
MPFIARPAAGQIIDPAWGTLVADAVVMRFATAAQRTSQLVAPVTGQLTALDSAPGVLEYWTGTAWAPVTPAREIAYTQSIGVKTVTATVESAADSVIAGPAVTYDGSTAIVIELFAPAAYPAAGAGTVLWSVLYQDGLSIGRIGGVQGNGAGLGILPLYLARRLTPTAGSHTFGWGAIVQGGTGSIIAGAGGIGNYVPAYMRITRAT